MRSISPGAMPSVARRSTARRTAPHGEEGGASLRRDANLEGAAVGAAGPPHDQRLALQLIEQPAQRRALDRAVPRQVVDGESASSIRIASVR